MRWKGEGELKAGQDGGDEGRPRWMGRGRGRQGDMDGEGEMKAG